MNKAEKLQAKRRAAAAKLTKPKPVELPSGSWRCQMMVKGERIDVIDEDPEVAHAKALAIKAGIIEKKKKPSSLTVGEAIDRYIESKDAVLSPATVQGYKKIRRNDFQELMGIPLPCLTQEAIQRSINKMAKNKAPKTVQNAHGLLSAALSQYYPDMHLRTTLPQKQKFEPDIPEDEDISKIMAAVKGTEIELPIILALWLGLRASEIRGIKWESIEGGILHVKEAIVQGEDGPTPKGTKSYSGDRKIVLPGYIKELIAAQPRVSEYVITISYSTLYKRFKKVCKDQGLPSYRFHDLRHAHASVMLALGVPDKYAMERMGHATNHMLKTVYQHTMAKRKDAVTEAVDAYYDEKLHTKLHTKD